MSFTSPNLPNISDLPGRPAQIRRRTVEGMEGMHSKMFDPPTENPDTPDLVVRPALSLPLLAANFPFPNAVPEVMFAAGFLNRPSEPHTVDRQLMHGMRVATKDGQQMEWFVFRDGDGIDGPELLSPSGGAFPAPTIRAPRGCAYRCKTQGSGPPPHTIHWHGFEPTPMNDGVGHCSFEIGQYTYQFQPNFIGSYFYHCHRNTMQHFEFGLYGFFIVDPPDAFYASIGNVLGNGQVTLNNIPIGNSRPRADQPQFPLGRRRIAANLDPALNPAFAAFGQTAAERVPLTTNDPLGQFPTDPHAYTVGYDVEALWVFDDRDIFWSNNASDARATFPEEGNTPGVDDNFFGNAGGNASGDFFAFHDFRSTHFYVTGFEVPGSGTPGPTAGGSLPDTFVIPPGLMSGVSGVQVPINASVDQTILVRILNAAYNNVRLRIPVDIVIIGWDGRALGVPPFGSYSAPVLVPANTPMEFGVGRRFDALIRRTTALPAGSFATVEFLDTRGRDVRFTARIPININGVEPPPAFQVNVTQATFRTRRRVLEVRATSTEPNAILTAFESGSGFEYGTLDRRGRLRVTVPGGVPDPVSITVRSDPSGTLSPPRLVDVRR